MTDLEALAGQRTIPPRPKWGRQAAWRRALRPIAETFAKQFPELDDEYLAALVEAANSVTASNCGWVEFHLAPAAAAIAEIEIENRTRARAQAQEADRG